VKRPGFDAAVKNGLHFCSMYIISCANRKGLTVLFFAHGKHRKKIAGALDKLSVISLRKSFDFALL
jgi:hypothetical protein